VSVRKTEIVKREDPFVLTYTKGLSDDLQYIVKYAF